MRDKNGKPLVEVLSSLLIKPEREIVLGSRKSK